MVCCALISFVSEWSQWRFLVNTEMNLLFSLKAGHLLIADLLLIRFESFGFVKV